MTIYGNSMVESDRGGVEYGGWVVQISRRIESVLAAVLEADNVEQVVSADLRALEVLCRAHPKECRTAIKKSQVRAWREALLPWMNQRAKSIPRRHREAIIDETRTALDFLEEVAGF